MTDIILEQAEADDLIGMIQTRAEHNDPIGLAPSMSALGRQTDAAQPMLPRPDVYWTKKGSSENVVAK